MVYDFNLLTDMQVYTQYTCILCVYGDRIAKPINGLLDCYYC